MVQQSTTGSSIPNRDADELYMRYGQEPREYSGEELEAAAISWQLFMAQPMQSDLYLRLVAVCEGSLSEATILWEGLRAHRKHGLSKYLERSTSIYTARYGVLYGVERTYNRAFSDLADRRIIVRLPTVRTSGYKFRVDWVELDQRLNGVQALVLPGLDEMSRETMQ